MQRSWESCWQGWTVLRIAGGVVVNPLVYKKIGPTFYYIRKVVRFYYCFFLVETKIWSDKQNIVVRFLFTSTSIQLFVWKKKKNRNDFCINIKLEKVCILKNRYDFVWTIFDICWNCINIIYLYKEKQKWH